MQQSSLARPRRVSPSKSTPFLRQNKQRALNAVHTCMGVTILNLRPDLEEASTLLSVRNPNEEKIRKPGELEIDDTSLVLSSRLVIRRQVFPQEKEPANKKIKKKEKERNDARVLPLSGLGSELEDTLLDAVLLGVVHETLRVQGLIDKPRLHMIRTKFRFFRVFQTFLWLYSTYFW